ncbi:MAG: hypothetical protein Kow0056_05960 [Coriobacteriia bacterium]
MGRMFQALKQIDAVIAEQGLDRFRTRGLISLKLGFMVGLISEDTPDDPEKLQALLDAAEEVLGVRIQV